jgi:sortase A
VVADLVADRKLLAVKPRGAPVKAREKEVVGFRPLTGLSLLTQTPTTREPTAAGLEAPVRQGVQSPTGHEVPPSPAPHFEPPPAQLAPSAGWNFQGPPQGPSSSVDGAVGARGKIKSARSTNRRRPQRHARRSSTKAAILRRTAYALLGAGALLLSFVAYQLWGTALYEGHAQAQLRQELQTKYGIASGTAQTTVPQSLQSQFGTSPHVAKTMPDPALGQPVGLMSIPRIGMTNDAIVEGTGEAQLEQGPGHYQGTPLPGETGNSAIAGHRTTYAAPFFNLNLLQPGDPIFIVTPQGHFEYVVGSQEVVDPGDTSVLDSSTQPLLTLTTCNPRYSATERLVVVARLRSSILTSGSAAPARSTTPSREPHGSSGQSTLKELVEALCWGALAAVLAVLTAIGWRRLWGLRAGLVLVVGLPAFVVTLLVCFAHVSLALPQTF